MKHAINFRLDEVVLKTIAELAQDLHTSKTDIVEQSILQFQVLLLLLLILTVHLLQSPLK